MSTSEQMAKLCKLSDTDFTVLSVAPAGAYVDLRLRRSVSD
jgi:hypothetical protein